MEQDRYPTGVSFYRDGVLYVAFNGTTAETAEDFMRGVNALVKAARLAAASLRANGFVHSVGELEDALQPFEVG